MNGLKQKGFTLIELMIVVALIGILASIAYPSFLEQVRKSKRSDATGALEGFANAMERHFTANGSYLCAAGLPSPPNPCISTGAPQAIFPAQSPTDGSAAAYNLTINAATAATYTLLATRAGSQATDRCGDLRLQHSGAKEIINQDAGVTADDCWY